VSDQELGNLIDRHVRAERTRTRPHDSLDRLLVPLPELRGPEKPQDHALVVHDHTRIPSRRRRAFTDRAYRLLQSAGGNIPASDVSRSSPRGVSPFGGEPGRQPIELSVYVVVYLLEPEALEPPRGSWAQVSGRIPAVDDDWLRRIESALGLGFEASERETDGPREMVLLELLPGQHLHHLRPFPHESLNVFAIDGLRHRYLPG